MRNQWFGDEGDFVKFRLLRRICGITADDGGPRLSLGVIWYFRESKRTDYLRSSMGYEQEDPELFRKLREWIEDERARGVSLIPGSGLFPSDTAWFSETVPPSWQERTQWFERALAKVAKCGVVFLDPDIGLQPPGGRGKGNYVLMEELKALCEAAPQCTAIVYQHRQRRKPDQQIEEQATQVRNQAGLDRAVVATWDPTLPGRLFYVVPAETDHQIVRCRIRELGWEPRTVLGISS